MFKLAFRNIFRNRLRTGLTLAAIVSGVVAIIISGGFVEDVFVQLREATIHSRTGHIQIFRHGYTEYGRREPARYVIAQPKLILDAVQSVPDIQAAMLRVNFSGLLNNGRSDLPIIGEGIEPDKEERLGTATTVVAGRPLRDTDTFGMMIGEGVAAALHLRPGSLATLMVNTSEGALNTLEYEVIGVFRTFSKEYDDRAVRIPFSAAQELLFTRSAHSIVLLLNDTGATDAVTATLRTRLEPLGYEVKPWYELADFYKKTEALYQRQFGVLQIIILVLLILSVASTINTVVYERTGEFGTLLALGSRPRQIFKLVLLENALLGLLGSVLGMILAIALAGMITSVGITMPPPPGSNIGYTGTIRLVPQVLIVAILIAALAAVIAAVLPARRASRLVVVDALRHNV